ncbi:hypothetical protein, partial [Escherichia coli]|uniref:hypothetical protein n=1 Tax=Escherichia coli TaxID=562 RepID=UPI002257342E
NVKLYGLNLTGRMLSVRFCPFSLPSPGFNVEVQLSLRQDHQLETAVSAGGTVARRRTPITNMP